MQGLGNDYIYVDCTKRLIDKPEELAVKLSNRNYGIGSDGLILIRRSTVADFFMDMYNADGSRGLMCGNGIRCVARYVYDKGLTGKTELDIETLSGIRHVSLIVDNCTVSAVRVDMGIPVFEPDRIPVKLQADEIIDYPIVIDGLLYRINCVSMGNPHCVVFTDKIDLIELNELGKKFESNVLFPDKINAEFAELIDKRHIKVRVFERGSGETLACGTGACAVLAAAVKNNLTQRGAYIHLPGGMLYTEWGVDGHIYMEGPAVEVYRGEIDIQ